MPEVTVIMGAKDGGQLLRAAVQSVRNQTMADWELVIVDNGSRDDAAERLVGELDDRRIRLIRHELPLGPGPALNVAAAAATGRHLAVLDNDDLALPRRLELQSAYLDWRTDTGLVGTSSAVIDGEGRPGGPEPFVGRHEELHAMLEFVNPLRHSSVMFRREVFDRVQYRAVAGPAADMDFLARVSETVRVACLPETLCHYRWHPANLSNTSALLIAVHGALVRMLIRRRRRGLPEDADRWGERFRGFAACPGGLTQAYHSCAAAFRTEGHDDLAAYYHWLAWRAGAGWGGAWRYLLGVGVGLWRNRSARMPLFRAWLKEPAQQLLRAGGMPDRFQF